MGQINNVKVSYRAERTPGGSHIVKVREGTCYTSILSVGQIPKKLRRYLIRGEFSSYCAEFRSASIARRVAIAMKKTNGRTE